MRFGILGAASIARRMMLPAFVDVPEAQAVAVASRDKSRAEALASEFGIQAEHSYESLLARDDIDAVYIPLPPQLHESWALRALESGKHVLCEKPMTTSVASAERMVTAARAAGKVLAENWMFVFHRQLAEVDVLADAYNLGELRLLRASFGIPELDTDNFRYRATLGGGALLDVGGYPIRVARHFLGDSLEVVGSTLWTPEGSEVDRFGSILLAGEHAASAQLAFGFDVFYQCELQLWFARGKITAPRIFTAPPGHSPLIAVETSAERTDVEVSPDNHFSGALRDFVGRIREGKADFPGLLAQARLMENARQSNCIHSSSRSCVMSRSKHD